MQQQIRDFINENGHFITHNSLNPLDWKILAKSLHLSDSDISHISLSSQFGSTSPTKTFLSLYRKKNNASLPTMILSFLNSLDDTTFWNKKSGNLLLSLIRNWLFQHHYPIRLVDDAVAGHPCNFHAIKLLLETSEIISLFILRFDPHHLWKQLATDLHFTPSEINNTLKQISAPSNPFHLTLDKWLSITPNPHLDTLLDALSIVPVSTTAVTPETTKQCVICLSQTLEILYMPCRHFVACQSCSDRLNKCPICRSNITSKIKVIY